MKSSNAITRIRRQLLSKKVGTFLICLSIASLLWMVHALNRNYQYTLRIPVKFSNLPTNKLIVGELPDQLDVDIKASGLKLIFISLKDHTEPLLIDFNALKTNAKSQAYSISNGNFNLKNTINFDVEILKIRPDTLFFSSIKGKSKLLPIKANLQTSFLPGYSITSKPVITPAYVTVTGDSIALNQIDTVYTNAVNIKDIHDNYNAIVGLKKNSEAINYNVKDVQLSFNVDRLTEATIKLPVQILNKTTGERIKLLPDVVTVTYLVSMNDYDNIDANSFKASVNYHQILAKQKTLPVELNVAPSEVKVLKIEPANISYLIYK